MARIIINADDIGLTPGATQGIVKSMLHGVVTSASFMASMPDSENAATQIQANGLDVGVHLNITDGKPLMPATSVPTLVNEKREFYSCTDLRARLRWRRVSRRDIEKEFCRQIERALDLGILPSHLDTHHHIHAWLTVAKAMKQAAARHKIRKLRTLRTADLFFRDSVVGNGIRDRMERWQKRYAGYRLTTGGFQTPLALMKPGVFRRPNLAIPGEAGIEDWIYLIERIGRLAGFDVFEIPCHPAQMDDALPRWSSFFHGREEDLNTLTSGKLKEAMARSGVQLISYRDF